MSNTKKSVAIFGASGVAGGELIRLLLKHPFFEIKDIYAFSSAGETLSQIHPNLIGSEIANMIFRPIESFNKPEILLSSLSKIDIIFFALPHTQSAHYIKLIESSYNDSPILIDLGADFRLESKNDWNNYYHTEYSGEAWVYGLPEISDSHKKRIATTKKVAVPGCNATAMILGLLPLIKNSLINTDFIDVVASVGYSGAGKTLKPSLLAVEAFSNCKPYSLYGSHRHIPEVVQELSKFTDSNISLNFTPILVPTNRGILVVINAKLSDKYLNSNLSQNDLIDIYRKHYCNDKFVNILDADVVSSTLAVSGSNYAQISTGFNDKQNIITSIVAIDNLVRGTAGQAIQCLNLMLGYDIGLSLEDGYGVK